ncbi:class IV adenylate cyclase [Botrimarina hoheduenensis]|uniref:CYTH domain protein n=1 Tax=Botrimarina hoheduenensis TaxID=2528000 RepID=A0A5C5WBT8_9BACT|nr:class IV adenylate cyclase [Botrimarina hoheduenensis]TWT48368.1 CYTH domain protein [Botrimarina hoheduenensis]
MLEVELKFALADPEGFRQRLAEQGGLLADPVTQSDTYFNHPARDFAATDEALRLRSQGDTLVVTYKGAKQPGTTKTRYELELPLVADTAVGWSELLVHLGFRQVLTVSKRRATCSWQRDNRSIEIAFDQVEGLGAFVEIEAIAQDDADRQAAEACVLATAGSLGLTVPEPRSYLEMLLAEPL